MTETLAQKLNEKGITDPRVLSAIKTVPREQFIPPSVKSQSDADHPLPIGYGQTISQPYIVARMTSLLLSNHPMQRVLEIGTGSGYQAAILSLCVEQVDTIECIKPLYQQAKKTLSQLQYNNVTTHFSDGNLGLPTLAPFDGIIITAATAVIPPALIDQLANNSRMVLPLGDPSLSQRLCVVSKNDDGSITQFYDEPVVFVPLVNFYGK